MGGTRLLQKSTFHTGHFPSTMHLVQSSLRMPTSSEFSSSSSFSNNPTSSATSSPLHQILHTTQSGTLALITPLSETTYRRLSGLATHLSQFLDSACGLNSKAFRHSDVLEAGWDAGTQRGMLDGNLLMRWGELGEQRRREGLSKWGGDEWGFGGEREVLGGWGIFGRRG
jgi:cleavage and polyadenylation specificity factor subunit 1